MTMREELERVVVDLDRLASDTDNDYDCRCYANDFRELSARLSAILAAHPQTEEQAARERLGRWLAAKSFRAAGDVIDNRAFAERDSERYQFSIYEDSRRRFAVDRGKHTGCGEDPEDAINAAINAAERSE